MRSPASLSSRLATVVVIGLVVAVMIVASRLQPDAKGYGTHQQLGLPPCGSVLFLGMKCPACGMTTAWSLAMRGRLADAWHANAGGLMLAVIAWSFMPLFGYYAVRGYWSRGGWLSLSLAICLSLAMMLAIAQWLTA